MERSFDLVVRGGTVVDGAGGQGVEADVGIKDGKVALDGRRSSIREIVEGPFFQELVPAGWGPGAIADGRLEPCVRACGAHDMHSAQYTASLL